MRTILVVAFLANLLISVWANTVFVAHAGQNGAVSINPASLMARTADLPAQEYPAF
jgi:hypothetical protein